MTETYVRACFDMYVDCLDPLWVCLPLVTTNGCSQVEPEWTCWDADKKDLWVRPLPQEGIHDPEYFKFYTPAMTFEHFIAEFEAWFDGVVLTGIRADESHDRYLGVFMRLKEEMFGNSSGAKTCTSNPIYDWRVSDIWTYYSKFEKPYNLVYDRMYQAGLSIHQMRICEPYGNEQRQGLHLFHVLEPQSWPKVCARVAGANTGALYARESGNVMGNVKVQLPKGHTWQSFALFLLDTMPTVTAEHYRNKISVYLKWYRDAGVVKLPDFREGDTTAKDEKGSWRRICKALLKNDYWCITLGFQPTKTTSYEAYKTYMLRRRDAWNIFPTSTQAETT